MLEASDVTVEHVRLRGAQMHAPLARQRLSYLLSSVALRPSRISPAAVLVVRSMRDPLPGGIAPQFASAAFPNPAWERAAQARLSALCAEAARPARAAVGASAEAVLFADYGELLACLALDCAAGAQLAWWWRSILRHHLARAFSARSDLWPRLWAEHPRYVPAALQQLDARRQAVRLLEQISAPQAWRLLLEVARACGLPASLLIAAHGEARPQGFVEEPSNALAPPQARSPQNPIAAAMPGRRESPGRSDRFTAPWEPYIAADAIPSTLGVERSALLGISLLLHRAPRHLVSPHFAPHLRSWFAAQREFETSRMREAQISAPGPASAVPSSPSAQRVDTVKVNGADARIAGSSGLYIESATESGPLPRAAAPTEAQHFAIQDGVENAVSDRAALDRIEAASPVPIKAIFPEAQVQFEGGCRTAVGGVFYLIHLLLRSGLLCFDVGLRGWALLELLARCLLQSEWRVLADDPVWDALAHLDFRAPGTPPGAEFIPKETYRAPENWLRGLDDSKRYARFRSGRLEVWLAEGFPILDSTAQADLTSCARMRREQRRVLRKDASVYAPGLELPAPLRRFLHFLLPYVRWRLRRALGKASLIEVLRRQGTLYITPSHVDLVMSMREISVPARIAGLDANPGWTPELGRIIKFHFIDDLSEPEERGGR